MSEDVESGVTDLGRLLAERARIDRELLEEHSAVATVLFTDIVGSTATYEAKGDIEGLRRVRIHNDALFPIVEENQGRVIKTIGDAIMAAFDDPAKGARCAIAMQRRLKTLSVSEEEPIEIRAGLHFGQVLVDGDDLFGDTVNTAARVASHADAGEVWVTETLLDHAQDPSLRAVEREALNFKGKADRVPCVRLSVHADDIATGTVAAEELLMIECVRARDGLRVALIDGAQDKGTVKQFEEQTVADDALHTLTTHFRTLAHGGGRSESYLAELKARGEDLAGLAFGPHATAVLRGTDRTHVRMHLDDALIDIPWELCDVGNGFLGVRYAMGRMVNAPGNRLVRAATDDGSSAVVIIANPTGDLEAASTEGRLLEALLREAGAAVTLLDGPRSKKAVCSAIESAAFVHFAGHATMANGQGALLCEDGPLEAEALREAFVDGDQSRAPALFFANACHMGGEAWTVGGFARSALHAGVEHFVAPTWEIPDADALFFALRFWEGALAGTTYGECARRGRASLAQDGKGPLSFAGYVLYGDPRRRFPLALQDAASPLPTRSERSGEFDAISAPPLSRFPSGAPSSAPLSDGASPPAGAQSNAPLGDGASPPAGAQSSAPLSDGASPSSGAAPASNNGLKVMAVVAGLALVGGVAAAAGLFSEDEQTPPGESETERMVPKANPSPSASPKTGPVAVSVLPFKNATGDAANDPLREGMMEAAVTALAGIPGTRLIERGQIDVDIGELEFSNSAYVDPATKAKLGRIVGAEVVVVGTTVAAANRLRTLARVVHVETGEVLTTVKVDGVAADVFALQDQMAEALAKKLSSLSARLRKTAPR